MGRAVKAVLALNRRSDLYEEVMRVLRPILEGGASDASALLVERICKLFDAKVVQ